MTFPVALQALEDYRPEHVRQALTDLLAPLGGMQAFVQPGQRVLIKPNLLAGKPPEQAVTTHPELVRQVILQVQAAGGIPTVGDSPGLGKGEVVARKCGIMDVVEATGARFSPFTESVPMRLDSAIFHHLEVARQALEAEVVINLPKLKTHQMMGYTGAVKNMFGLVVGMRKARLHLQAGTDQKFFALMLLELAERFKPDLSIMDAVVGMEGNGPGSGDPVQIGTLLASSHPLALDTAAIRLVGLPEQTVWTQQVARETGREGAFFGELRLLGTPLAELRVPHFRPARATDVNFGLPGPARQLLRRATTARPEIGTACRLCGQCTLHCPPEAMRQTAESVEIDDDRCIRCFCCQELCPHGAITVRQGLLLRLAEFIQGRAGER